METTFNANTTTQSFDQMQATLNGAKRSLQSGIEHGRSQISKAVESGTNVLAYGAAIATAPFVMAGIFAAQTVKSVLPRRAWGMLTVLGLIVAAGVVRGL